MAERLHKTTVYLDAAEMKRIEGAARELGKSTAALIREALRLYAELLKAPAPIDLQHAKKTLEKYPVGLTDALVAALAERSGRRIATVDRRDFDRLRTSGGRPFLLVP